mgnify:CR=1 FL=1
MKKIINPISTSILEKEINKNTFVRKTNYCNHDIYIVDYHNHPNATMEIGRLRELSFRNAGGGTGKSYDLDEFDTREEADLIPHIFTKDQKLITFVFTT